MDFKEYFQSYQDYFWQWEENGDVIAIPNGSTIAYRAFVIDVLEKLADQGMPPFGALLLAIVATNPKGEEDINSVYALLDRQLTKNTVYDANITSAITFLKQLAQIPQQYKAGRNRLFLLQTLFANCHNIRSVSHSKNILQSYKGSTSKGNASILKPIVKYSYNSDFYIISLLSKRFPTVQSIIDKIANLPEIRETIEIKEAGEADTVQKDFVQELTENPKTFHIGSLVKRLWSGLNIPFHNVLSGQQPIGGVSDLTNKGDFNRLLISEFANDDLIFLSRLANNEALYINRELPPQNNNPERIMLIDISIKNWGTPKTIAYALMLAIAKHPKTDISCSAFAVGNSYYPLEFDSISAVIESLQLLDGCLHPANGLEKFFNENRHQKNREVFFISSTETVRQAAFNRVLSDYHDLFSYWLYTDGEGNIDLYKRQHNSKKHVQHIQLPLEDLWKKEIQLKKSDNINETNAQYPILFPSSSNFKRILITDDRAIFQITAERKLLRLFLETEKPNRKGWQMMHEDLPITNGEFAMGKMENDDYVLLMFNTNNREVTILNIHTGEKKSVYFNEWRSSAFKQFVFHHDHFYYIGNISTYAISCIPEVKIIETNKEVRQQLIDLYKTKEELGKSLSQQLTFSPVILKNITSVFINEVNNLVFNIHELRLNEYGVIKIEKTGFLKKIYEATVSGKNEFTFPKGSTITINRAGMLILKNNEQTIYVPSVLEASLGVATIGNYSGNTFYLPSDQSGKETMKPKRFWDQYMVPFIENIIQHGA